MASGRGDAVERLAATIREAAMELAREVVEEGVRDDAIPSLERVSEVARLGDMPIFIVELAQRVGEADAEPLRRGGALAALARDHAREREALGFAPREVVTEFLLLRRVLWRFVSRRSAELAADDFLVAERRLNDTIDRLVVECVVAYFDRVTSELAYQARRDPLTELLNHQALTHDLEQELERARRYGHGLTLVYFDVDRFKRINDTLGHLEGDRVLRVVAALVGETVRRTDLAGRMGGDEFAVALVESDLEAGGTFLARLVDRIDERATAGELPRGFSISPGLAHFPSEGDTAQALFKLADARLYEAKRGHAE
jgi:diguanylate cyclase (GGDEF)-like protein